jgi:YfiH family protein
LLRQVHGNRVVRLGDPDFAAGRPAADAVIGDEAGALCVVQTADCLPVLMCAGDGSEVAAVHAGWRGLAGGVVDATIAAMSAPAEELLAWLGPAIGQARFEVGGEVRDAFEAAGFDCKSRFTRNDGGRWQADLFGLAKDRLRACGVTAISGRRDCTYDQPDRYFSYRRDGTTSRMLSYIYRS